MEEPERSEIGLFFITDDRLHLRIISSSPAAGTRAAELSALVARLQQAGSVPANLPLHRAKGAVWRPPAGAALEMETHVAKRCLLAGTAGGFCEPVTGQTLYPSVASALLAAQAAAKALDTRDVHAALETYRTYLAEAPWRAVSFGQPRPSRCSCRWSSPIPRSPADSPPRCWTPSRRPRPEAPDSPAVVETPRSSRYSDPRCGGNRAP